MNRRDLQELAKVRLKEATALLRLGMCDGAYYLAGYSVECALKACIARETQRYEFPDRERVDSSYTHSLAKLVKVAGLEGARAERAAADGSFRDYWDVVQTWSEKSRYQRHPPDSARKLLLAITDRNHGVVSWIKLHW